MSKTFLTVSIIFALILVGFFLVQRGVINLPTANNIAPAPDFALKDIGGNDVTLSDFTGTPMVINSWASWCPFCIKELPAFAEAQKELGNKVVIIAISRAESLDITKKYTDDLGITNNLIYLLDPKDSFYRSIGGFSMPETIFVDTSGNVRFHKRGPMEKEEIIEIINTYLF